MIRIQELFRLSRLGNLRLLAGKEGLSRKVTAAVLFEYDPSRMNLADFYRGDLVVTTLAFARGDEALVQRTLVALMNQGVAGLLVKTAYFDRLPEPVLAMANRLGTPVFFFDDTYIEEVILDVTELIRGSRHFSGHEKELDELMSGALGAAQAREYIRRLDPAGAERYAVAALCPKEQPLALEGGLYDALYGEERLSARFACAAWRGMLFVLCRLRADETHSGIEALLQRAGVPREGLHVGESSPCAPGALGVALCEAMYAARAARLLDRPALHERELGLYAYLLPMGENAFVRARCEENLRRIRAYDARNRTNLEQTANAYVEQRMEIAAAAKALYQHPNTVRYRLGRIRELLGARDDEELNVTLLLTVRLARIAAGED